MTAIDSGVESAITAAPVPLRAVRTARARRYPMCPSTHVAVMYAINPSMEVSLPVDRPPAALSDDATLEVRA